MFDTNDLSLAINLISSSIQSENRKKRKNTLEDLKKELAKYNAETPELADLFDGVRHVLWGCLNDEAETVRDSAVDLLLEVFQNLPASNKYVEEVIPVLLHRLGGSASQESSEEMRLKFVQLLQIILERFEDNIEVYSDDIVQVLTQTLVDKFPRVRQESAKCCVTMANISSRAMYDLSCKLVQPIITSFKHNHSRTRISAIQALSAVLKEANWKTVEAQFVFGSLGNVLFDDAPGVRLALVELLGTWLLHLRDRYSFFSRMVPLMLGCLGDAQPEVSARAWAAWSAAGRQYITENEQELKDKLDFMDEKPLNYPSKVERPNLGCRTLVQRHLCQMTAPLLQELTDWQPAVCVKASAVLSMATLHAEAELTQHAETWLLAMYRAAEDKKGEVPQNARDNVEQAAGYMGNFVAPAMWHQLVFPIVEAEPNPGNLFILAALLRGSAAGVMDPYAEKLAAILATTDISHSSRADMQLETLKCCSGLLDNVSTVSQETAQSLLFSLIHVTAATNLNGSPHLTEAGKDCLEMLAEKLGVSVAALIRTHVTWLVTPMLETVAAWYGCHSHFKLLLFLLSQPGAVWLPAIDLVMEILRIALKLENRDAEVKSFVFEALAAIFAKEEVRQCAGDDAFTAFSLDVVNDLIIPNLTWRAGLSAERLRTVVLACLVVIMRDQSPSLPSAELVPPLVGVLKDAPTDNRKLALECIRHAVKMADTRGLMSPQLVNDIYPQVVDRLDDVDSEVREAAIATLDTLFTRLPAQMTQTSHGAIFAHLVTAMLPYLDDDSPTFATSVCDALKVLGSRAPDTIKEKLSARQHLFKSQHLCTQLLEHLHTSS